MATLLLLATAVILLIACSNLTEVSSTCNEVQDNPRIRPGAFSADEIFLPRSLLSRINDESLHDLLVDRDANRLDSYFEARGLRDVWFVVRYRSIDSEGKTWRGTEGNFESKKYDVRVSHLSDPDQRRHHLEVLTRVLSRAAGKETDALISSGLARDPTVSLIYFENAKIIPIPEEATNLNYIIKENTDEWRSRFMQQNK